MISKVNKKILCTFRLCLIEDKKKKQLMNNAKDKKKKQPYIQPMAKNAFDVVARLTNRLCTEAALITFLSADALYSAAFRMNRRPLQVFAIQHLDTSNGDMCRPVLQHAVRIYDVHAILTLFPHVTTWTFRPRTTGYMAQYQMRIASQKWIRFLVHDVIEHGHLHLYQHMCSIHTAVVATQDKSPIRKAIQFNRLSFLHYFITSHPDVYSVDDLKHGLRLTCAHGHLTMLQYLLSRIPTRSDGYCNTTLAHDGFFPTYDGNILLRCAISHHQMHIIYFLLEWMNKHDMPLRPSDIQLLFPFAIAQYQYDLVSVVCQWFMKYRHEPCSPRLLFASYLFAYSREDETMKKEILALYFDREMPIPCITETQLAAWTKSMNKAKYKANN